jgi:arginine N-succinyltransferase
MVYIRPAHVDDLEPLAALAELAGVGITTLPKDRDLLARRIQKSQRSFERIPDRPGGESYLFVMEDAGASPGDGRPAIVGASGIVSKVGGFEPFYAFRIDSELHACEHLGVRTDVPYLKLVREHDGPCEIGSLFLHPDYRGRDHGRLLQLVRFLFLAEHRDAFETTVVSELRGVIDEHGRSPFWDAVGRHFFDIDFPRADYLSVVNKRFIADLMPVHPIYIPLLPAPAQAVIGQAHASSRPALRNLEAEGFRFSGMVDIFDAGPCVSCPRDEIRTVRESRCGVVRAVTDREIVSPAYAVARRRAPFRACVGAVEVTDTGDLRVGTDLARGLDVDVGESLRFAPLRPAATSAAAVVPLEAAMDDKEGSD